MRAILDHVTGGVWHHSIERPAIRHMSRDQLSHAVATAERLVADPAALPALNRASLAKRATAAV